MGKYCFGIDVGGTSVKCGLFQTDGVLVEKWEIPTRREKVKGGQPLSRPLRTSGIFPPMIVHMVGIGEETGNLEEMLDNVADYYDEEVTMATEQMTALLEPLVIVFLAVIVVAIIAAVYAPMMTLYNGIG